MDLCTSFLFVFLSLFMLTCGDDEFDGLSTLSLEHSFDQGSNAVFAKRGTINIQSLKAGNAYITQDVGLTLEQRETLVKLAAAGGIYKIRVPTRSGASHVTSFVKACALYESRLSDLITVNVDQSSNVLGVSISTPIPYCSFDMNIDEEELSKYNTTVDVVQTVTGPSPDTQSYVEKIEAEKAEKVKGQSQDNRSFFAKYWMYLVPLFIFLMFASNADGGGGGGGR